MTFKKQAFLKSLKKPVWKTILYLLGTQNGTKSLN